MFMYLVLYKTFCLPLLVRKSSFGTNEPSFHAEKVVSNREITEFQKLLIHGTNVYIFTQ